MPGSMKRRFPEVLRGFVEAYQRGLAGMGAHSPAWEAGVFDDRLREQLEARCDLIQLLRVRSFLDYRRKGLVAARKDDLDSSRREFRRAEESLQSLRESEARLLCESLYCAALAYLHYRCEQPERSRELVHRALAIDSELEIGLGAGALYGHRFQLVQNLVHVEARYGDPESATRIGLAMLDQLEGKPNAAPTPHPWSPSDPDQVPVELRRALANQIVFELAAIHLRSHARGAETRRYAEHIATCRARDEVLAVESHDWLRFASAVETADLADAVDLANGYLQRGPGDSPALWYCVVLQCAERLPEHDSEAARSAASAIQCDRATWLHAPSILRGPAR